MRLAQPIVDQLRAVVGNSHVLTAPEDTVPFSEDIRGYVHAEVGAVVQPAQTTEVAAVVRLLNENGVGFVPQGGNTGLCAGAIPNADAPIVIAMRRMNAVSRVDPVNLTMEVQAGASLSDIRAAAADVGCMFPLSIAAEGSCQIGGNIATNAGGHNVLRYGSMRTLVLGLEVVLPNGDVWDGMNALRKDNTGYDLKQFFIGSEGTLGLITGAVLALVPEEARGETALLSTPNLQTAIELLGRVRRSAAGLVSAFEYFSRPALHAAVQHVPGLTNPLGGNPDHLVLIELAKPPVLPEDFSLLEPLFESGSEAGLVIDGVQASSAAQRAGLWALRDGITEGLRVEGGLVAHDVSVPIDRIASFVDEAGRRLESAFPGCRPVPFGHLGDGNLHYNVQYPKDSLPENFLAQREAVNRIVYDLVAEMDGSFSAEHGVGSLKLEDMNRYKSATALDLMRRIKAAFDPDDRTNPGKLVPKGWSAICKDHFGCVHADHGTSGVDIA